ncbi:hypothetical protein T265_05986 [Opisthorchis viverrini]|uniref:Uncharacterized protein n=1 Tax=Opisthorchis viverrini TaxID=6198 RepID=A0A074ZIN0_OPIVI|nr:hypothetical protein T265_05986 [Opisthorchis viverrini]KER26856.1 hypothetical protein T265_05986 [Opisthorchis viverrini]
MFGELCFLSKLKGTPLRFQADHQDGATTQGMLRFGLCGRFIVASRGLGEPDLDDAEGAVVCVVFIVRGMVEFFGVNTILREEVQHRLSRRHRAFVGSGTASASNGAEGFGVVPTVHQSIGGYCVNNIRLKKCFDASLDRKRQCSSEKQFEYLTDVIREPVPEGASKIYKNQLVADMPNRRCGDFLCNICTLRECSVYVGQSYGNVSEALKTRKCAPKMELSLRTSNERTS